MRPDPASPAEELRLRVALLPVRVRADQRVVEFLAAFFAPPDDMVLVPSVPVVPPPQAGTTNHEPRQAAEDDGREAEGALLGCAEHAQASHRRSPPCPIITSQAGSITQRDSTPAGLNVSCVIC